MTTRIQGDVYEAIKKRVEEINKEFAAIQYVAQTISGIDQRTDYVLEKVSIMKVMDTELNLLNPLFEFYENINELNY